MPRLKACTRIVIAALVAALAYALPLRAQSVSTTTVQGTVYLASGASGSGTVQVSWPAFTTANNLAVAAGRTNAQIGADGFLSVNLTPNLGASPAGLFYTVVYHLSDGTTSTEYWVVPAAAQASIASVRAQVMPAAQAVQAVSKAYVDNAIQSLAQGSLTPVGGTLSGPLYLPGDPTQALQAADKHYVDATFAQALPLSGGAATGPLTASQLGAAWQVDQFPGVDFGAKLQACINGLSVTYGGTCDARNFSGTLAMASGVTIATANTAVMLPCATITTSHQIVIPAGTRNVSLRGCTLRGSSAASGTQGGTVFMYSGAASMLQIGDPTYISDTQGFHLDNVAINTTTAANPTAQAIAAYRTQEMDLQSLYLLGNSNQTGMTLDGTGNYTGGTFYDNAISGFQIAVNAIGHQASNPATTDWLNASTFLRLHINCPTGSGNPIAGTIGINLAQGDGNTITGGDVEGCATAVHLGSNAQNNTFVGLRNENSTSQVIADAGSSYNNWMTGGTMFTGKLTDNGTRNSFLDTFHRSFNGMTGDWYGSQQDATVTNHYRLGTGTGNERGLYNRYQTDYGYRWTTGLSDATAGEQFYQVLDELNNVYRLSIGQYNNGQASTNNQTVINAAGTGAVVLNGSNNSGTGGVVFGSGGPAETTVATLDNAGNAQFNGTLRVGGLSTFLNSTTVRNSADAEIDAFLWAGATANQKESFIYKDFTGASQWYMVKDASNNWALNSAIGGIDSFKAYQSNLSGDTYINASNSSGVVRVNYENGSGAQFKVYGGNSGTPYASFTGAAAIQFPGLAASSGKNCVQVDNSGYLSNTGAACGSGSDGGGSGTVNNGNSGQIAYYSANGTSVSGMNAVPVAAGGTGATTAAAALSSLGAASLLATAAQSFAGPVAAPSVNASVNSQINVMAAPYNARGDCSTDDQPAIQAAINAAGSFNPPAVVYFPKPVGGCYLTSALTWNGASLEGQPSVGVTPATGTAGVILRSKPGQDILHVPDPASVATAAPARSWSIRDLVFQVDDSIDASASYPHRWPGRWFNDAAITAGSAVFTSASSAISCGDVGQKILVKGAGVAGADLSTTISSVTPCAGHRARTITLATAAATTVSSAAAYITPLNIPLTATIGNCSIAMDDRDGNPANWTMTGNPANLYDTLWNTTFTTVSGNAQNNSCGLYTQGVWGMYGLDARNISVARPVWGIVQGAPETNSWYQSDANDFQLWDHGVWNLITYPWISYNGGENTLKHIQLATTYGPQILSLGNRWYDAVSNWTINAPEFEMNSGGTGWRIEGRQNLIENTTLSGGTSTAYFDADDTVCNNCSVFGHLVLNGMQNDIRLGGDISINTMDVSDRGFGNTVTGAYNSNPQGGADTTRYAALNITRGPLPAGIQTADFVRSANLATPYFNDLDLFFWPHDFIVGSGAATPIADTSSLTGAYYPWANSATVSNFANLALADGRASNPGTTLTISNTAAGGNVPATNVIAYASVKCASASTVEFDVYAGATQVASSTPSCATGYSTVSLPANLTAYAGQSVAFRFNSASGNPMVAWIALRPFQADYNGRQPVLANASLSTTGAGAAVPTGPATSTSGNVTTFSGTQGQIQDSGVALASLPSLIAAGTQTFAASLAAPSVNSVVEASQYPSFAAAVAATPSGGRMHLAAGYTATITSTVTVANPLTVQCDPGSSIVRGGALLQPAITVTATNVVFNGCSFDGGNANDNAGTSVISVSPGSSGFTFKNGKVYNFNDTGILAAGVQNFTIANSVITDNPGLPGAGGIQIYGDPTHPTANIHITNNVMYGHIGIISGSTGGNLSNITVQGNNLYPMNGQFAVEIGDFSTAQISYTDGFIFSGNTCTITGTSSGHSVHGCFSSANRVTNLNLGPNTYNAVGQYIDIAIVELGAPNPTVGPQIINAGQDPTSAQGYSGILAYLGGSFTGERVTGWGANGAGLEVYAQGNADGLSITGGSFTADATANSGSNGARGIYLYCNQAGVSARVTAVGSGGAVTAMFLNNGNGGGYTSATGQPTFAKSGSGSGLTVNTTVDANGAIVSVSVNSAGTGYKIGDLVQINGSGAYFGGSIRNAEIGGGLTINGGVFRGIDAQDADGTNHCPVTTHLGGITINGAVNASYIGGIGANASFGDVRLNNVNNPAPTFASGATASPANFPNGVALSNLTASPAYLCAAGTNGSVTNIGCSNTLTSTFTPTAIGWYRIINATATQIAGTIDISTSNYSGHELHDRFNFVGTGNGGASVLNAALISNYGGSYGPMDQIEVSGNNATGIYVDVHINDITSPQPITVTYSGQSLPQSAVIQNPVVGAAPGSYSTAVINLAALSMSPQVTHKTTGMEEAASFNAITGYSVNGTALAATNLSNGVTGTGNVVLSNGPTFKGNTTTFANAAAAEQDVVIQPGSSADQVGALQWSNYSGTAQWKLRKDASNYMRLTDTVNSLDRAVLYQNGQTILNAGAGANAVVLNGTASSGTGGLLVQNGGASPATVFTVTGSGNTTATGFVAGKSMAGTGSMTLAAGSAAGTSPTIACAASHVCDGVSGDVALTTGTSPATGALATLTFPSAHTNYANCLVKITSSTAQVTTLTWNETASAVTLTANAALSASTAYQIRYWCGGN